MRLTSANPVLAYMMLVIIGVTFNLAGVLTIEIAREFGIQTHEVGYAFSLFTGGYTVTILGSGWLLGRFPLKQISFAAVFLTVVGAGGITASAFPMPFGFLMLVFGAGEGLLCAIAYCIVINSFSAAIRTVKLNLLNFFYSLGAIVSPLYAGGMLAAGISWQFGYQTVAALALLLGAGIFIADLGSLRTAEPAATESGGRWTIGIYLMAAALFLYVNSEVIFSYWVVVYLQDVRNWDVASGGIVLSVFWLFMAIGRLVSGLGWLTMPVHRQILLFAASACLALAGLLYLDGHWPVYVLTACMGLGYSILYATVLAYGTLLVANPSARLMTFFITCGSLGNIASLVISSFLKQQFDVSVCLWVSAGFMAAVAVLTLTVRLLPGSSADI